MNVYHDQAPIGAQWQAQALQQHGSGPKPAPPPKDK